MPKRLEAVYCGFSMPLKLALGVRGTVAGRRLGALPMHLWFQGTLRAPLGTYLGKLPGCGATAPLVLGASKAQLWTGVGWGEVRYGGVAVGAWNSAITVAPPVRVGSQGPRVPHQSCPVVPRPPCDCSHGAAWQHGPLTRRLRCPGPRPPGGLSTRIPSLPHWDWSTGLHLPPPPM